MEKKKLDLSAKEKKNFYNFKRKYSNNELEIEALIRDFYGDSKGLREIEAHQKDPQTVRKLIEKLTLPIANKDLIQLKKNWQRLLGSLLAKKLIPFDYKKNELTLICENSHSVSFLKEKYERYILEKVCSILPKTKNLIFKTSIKK